MHHPLRICPNNNFFNSGEKKIINLCQEILREYVVKIRFLSKLIGDLVAVFSAVTLEPFYYRALETDKAKAL